MESSLYIIHYNRGGLKYGHYRITGSWHWHTNIAHSQHDDGQTVSIYRYILYYYRLMYIRRGVAPSLPLSLAIVWAKNEGRGRGEGEVIVITKV